MINLKREGIINCTFYVHNTQYVSSTLKALPQQTKTLIRINNDTRKNVFDFFFFSNDLHMFKNSNHVESEINVYSVTNFLTSRPSNKVDPRPDRMSQHRKVKRTYLRFKLFSARLVTEIHYFADY